MEDIAPKLLEKIQIDFMIQMNESKKIADLYKRVRDGTATYKNAQDFAMEAGKILAEVFEKNISSSVLPDGKLYYNIANRIIPPMLKNNYNLASDLAISIQEIINKTSGISLKAVRPDLNRDKIAGIVDIVSGVENYDEISYMLRDPVINFTQCVIDDTVRANADFQNKAGLSPKIVRTSSGKCCDWCDKLAGMYSYEDVKDTGNNVFRRHKNCICLVELVSGGKRQNTHSKKWADEEDVKRRIENSFTKMQPISKRTKEQAEALEERLKIKYVRK